MVSSDYVHVQNNNSCTPSAIPRASSPKAGSRSRSGLLTLVRSTPTANAWARETLRGLRFIAARLNGLEELNEEVRPAWAAVHKILVGSMHGTRRGHPLTPGAL